MNKRYFTRNHGNSAMNFITAKFCLTTKVLRLPSGWRSGYDIANAVALTCLGFDYRRVKSGAESSTARHRCDAFLEFEAAFAKR